MRSFCFLQRQLQVSRVIYRRHWTEWPENAAIQLAAYYGVEQETFRKHRSMYTCTIHSHYTIYTFMYDVQGVHIAFRQIYYSRVEQTGQFFLGPLSPFLRTVHSFVLKDIFSAS